MNRLQIVSSVLRSRKKRNARRSAGRRRAVLESLENRQLLATDIIMLPGAGAVLSDDTGPNGEPIYDVAAGTDVRVTIRGVSDGDPADDTDPTQNPGPDLGGYQLNFDRTDPALNPNSFQWNIDFQTGFLSILSGSRLNITDADELNDNAAGAYNPDVQGRPTPTPADFGSVLVTADGDPGELLLLTVESSKQPEGAMNRHLRTGFTGGTVGDFGDILIRIADPNTTPVANDDTATIDEDMTGMFDVLANDSDPDGDTLTIDSVGTSANATISISGNQIQYVPNANFNGTDSFTYVLTDGSRTDTATVDVTINAQPDAPNGVTDTPTTLEDTPITFDALANDTDPDGDTLSVMSVTDGSSGTVTNDGGGMLTYTPDLNFNGADSFSYVVSDGALTDTVTVNVTVIAQNDAPTAADDNVSTAPDTPVTIDVLANDTDVEGDDLTITIAQAPSNGTAEVSGDMVVYTPGAGAAIETFTYRIDDGNGGTDTATVTVVVDQGEPPVAVDDTATGNEDEPLVIDVLGNDTDPDDGGICLTCTVVSATDGANGTVTVAGDGSSVTYLGNANFNGSDTFTYTIQDQAGNSGGTATVSVTLNPVNDAPVAVNDSTSTTENLANTINPAINDTDVDGDSLRVVSVTNATNGTAVLNPNGTVTFTPAGQGTGSYDYVVSDVADNPNGALTDTGTVTITISDVNFPPAPVNDIASVDEDMSVMINVLGNDNDPDGDALTLVAVSDPANGTATIMGDQVQYTPDPNFDAQDTFTYTVSDGIFQATAMVTVNVNPVNDAPTANNDALSASGTTTVNLNVLGNDSDVDGDSLTIASVGTSAAGATVETDGDRVQYTPAPGFQGTDSFQYTISDGELTDTATVTVAVSPQRYFSDGTNLFFVGTEGRDRIIIQPLTFDTLNILIRTDQGNFGPLPLLGGRIMVDGGDGNDTISVSGNLPVVYDGGAGNDRLVGGTGDDTIMGGPGNDEILGGEGANYMDGGAGNDRITGRDGDEILIGGLGNDILLGAGGADVLMGNEGRDTITGGSGKDILDGGEDDDILEGSHGDDLVHGGEGNDKVRGGDNDDVVIGGSGLDGVNGGRGQDALFGGTLDTNTSLEDLSAILAAWSAGTDLASRVAAIDGLISDNDDGEADNLIGGGSADWFASAGDTLVDFSPSNDMS